VLTSSSSTPFCPVCFESGLRTVLSGLIELIKPYFEGVISRTITYGAVRNRTGKLDCFILEAAKLLVYLAQTQVVPRNVLKKAT